MIFDFQQLLDEIIARADRRERFMIGIAGPPGAGKSTLAERLVSNLSPARVVPMDGFHYDNLVLHQLGLRARKGAPETFDFAGFLHTLKRLKQREDGVAIPVFDRKADLARAGASLIGRDLKFIVAEGNYLLLDEQPWTELDGVFDLTAFLDVSRGELQRRLMKRWLDLGDAHEKAEHWVTTNDLPNVDRVLARVRRADIRVG